jgi:hypothetical protein
MDMQWIKLSSLTQQAPRKTEWIRVPIKLVMLALLAPDHSHWKDRAFIDF